MSAYKLVFSGPVGAGKTTAIAAISDVEPFTTEEIATDETSEIKENTTVAMDYGMMKLDTGDRIHLYGTPGQARFDFMWEILTDGAIGLILLVNHSNPKPLEEFDYYLDQFGEFIAQTGIAVGVTRYRPGTTPSLDDYHARLAERNIFAPVFEVDARHPGDVATLTQALLYSLDPGVDATADEL